MRGQFAVNFNCKFYDVLNYLINFIYFGIIGFIFKLYPSLTMSDTSSPEVIRDFHI